MASRGTTGLFWGCAFLVVVNTVVAWPLFFVEYLDYPGSIEGLFIALVRYYREHWDERLWFPFWNLGMPFAATYQPLLHALGALISAAGSLSAPRAFHVAVATLYVLGPATLFLLLYRLLGRFSYALAGGVMYSLISPSHFLVSAIREDSGALLGARRLYTAVAWGDAPHVTSLTFVPLALLGIDLFVRERGARYWVAGALGVSSVFLTNIPGTIVLAMGTVAYFVARPLADWLGSGFRVAAVAGFGYALCAFLVPPSVLVLVVRNVEAMAPAGSNDGRAAGWAVTVACLVAIRFGLQRTSFPLRFSACFFWIVAAVVLGSYWFGVSLLEQPQRFHLAMEMAFACLAVCTVWELAPLVCNARAKPVATVSLAVLATVQLWNYSSFSRLRVRSMDMSGRSEMKVARWLHFNGKGGRAYLPGSTAFWLNAFTDTAQVTGCCSQNRLMRPLWAAEHVIGTDDGADDRALEISRTWLQVLGVDYVNVAGPRSTEHYRTIHNWRKFEGHFEEVWRDGDDVIYRVPRGGTSLAHTVHPHELPSREPVNGLDIEPLMAYAAATTDPERDTLAFRWRNHHAATIEGDVRQGQLISVQIPYHAGWTANREGETLPLRADAIGFLVIEPKATGPLTLRLEFTGGTELAVARGVSLAAVMLALAVIAWGARRRQPEQTAQDG